MKMVRVTPGVGAGALLLLLLPQAVSKASRSSRVDAAIFLAILCMC
jgi:hypothetical protein